MTLSSLLELLVGNLGISLGDITLLMVTMGSLIFFAVDFRLGVVLLFFMWSTLLALFSALNMPTNGVILLSFSGFVFLTLSLYISVSKNRQAVF